MVTASEPTPVRGWRRLAGSGRQGRSQPERWETSGYFFIAPQMLGFLAFVVGPIAAVFYFSLHNFNLVDGTFVFIGLDNYSRMLSDATMNTVAGNTVVFSVAYVILSVVAGLALAVLVDQRIRGMVVFRTLYFLPVVISLSAWTIVWRFLLQPNGGINGVLSTAGIEGPNWLRQPALAMATVILVQMLKNVGMGMVFFLAALQEVPDELKEVARVDGASPWQVFRHIILPLITPVIFLVTTLTVVVALKSFSLIFLMTNGGPGRATTVLAYYIYSVGFRDFEQGYASALAVILFLAVMALTIVQFVIRKKWVFYET